MVGQLLSQTPNFQLPKFPARLFLLFIRRKGQPCGTPAEKTNLEFKLEIFHGRMTQYQELDCLGIISFADLPLYNSISSRTISRHVTEPECPQIYISTIHRSIGPGHLDASTTMSTKLNDTRLSVEGNRAFICAQCGYFQIFAKGPN